MRSKQLLILRSKQPKCDSPAFVFIHPIGGQVYWYRELGKKLSEMNTVYMIQAEGVTTDQCALEPLQNIAAGYAHIILNEIPEQKIILIAWSFGCEIAFRLTQCLENTRKKVVKTILIDPHRTLVHADQIPSCFLEILNRELNIPILSMPEKLNTMSGGVDIFVDNLLTYLIKENHVDVKFKNELFKSFRVYLHHLTLMTKIKRDGSIASASILFAKDAEEDNFTFMRQDLLSNWTPYIKEIVVATNINGNHYSMLKKSSEVIIHKIIENTPYHSISGLMI